MLIWFWLIRINLKIDKAPTKERHAGSSPALLERSTDDGCIGRYRRCSRSHSSTEGVLDVLDSETGVRTIREVINKS